MRERRGNRLRSGSFVWVFGVSKAWLHVSGMFVVEQDIIKALNLAVLKHW
jgi:hypothetical protein